MTNYDIVSNSLCELGEGGYWDSVSETQYWVDIKRKKLFSLKNNAIQSWKLSEHASAVLDVYDDSVIMASESGIIKFSLKKKVWGLISPVPNKYSAEKYRANDGVKVSNDVFLYGIMNNQQDGERGAIIISKDQLSKVVCEDISIPNTFVRIPGTTDVLISDSFEQKVYKFCFNKDWAQIVDKTTWLDLSGTDDVPDGGCISSEGDIFISLWDGFRVIKLNMCAEIQGEYLLPVPRPTSCTLSGNEKSLYVTSAFEGLPESTIIDYPLSGSVFKMDVHVC